MLDTADGELALPPHGRDTPPFTMGVGELVLMSWVWEDIEDWEASRAGGHDVKFPNSQ